MQRILGAQADTHVGLLIYHTCCIVGMRVCVCVCKKIHCGCATRRLQAAKAIHTYLHMCTVLFVVVSTYTATNKVSARKFVQCKQIVYGRNNNKNYYIKVTYELSPVLASKRLWVHTCICMYVCVCVSPREWLDIFFLLPLSYCCCRYICICTYVL